MKKSDTFGRLDYRRFVAWKKRVERERPFLLSTFGEPSKKPLVDLGCGTGEHADLLASEGFAVVGLDLSAAMLAKAREAYGAPRFVRGLLDELPFRGEGTFAGALCLGNTLVNLPDDERISTCFRSLRHDELGRLLEEAGFGDVRMFGDYTGGRYDRARSSDVIAVARR